MEYSPDDFKAIEKELDLHREKLKISQSLIKIGFWELSLVNNTIFLSDEAIEILKLDKTKSILSFNDFAELASENEKNILKTEIEELVERQGDLNIEFSLNNEITGQEIIIKAIANSSVKSEHAPNTIIGIVQDITEQKKNESLLKLAKERAEEADILKSAFLANMSHEIRTPLNAILGFSKLLTNTNLGNDQRKEYSEYITSSANNLLNLIRDIVDVSKIEADKIVIEKGKCQVNKVLKELKFTYEREKVDRAKEHIDIRMNAAVASDNFAIQTDPFRFHQILVNLIGNALKFIEKGYIEFGYVVQGKSALQFYVKDTGIGIPDDKMELIFSRFGQIIDNKIKNPGGTGLGLSITKHLVERLGGKIWVESEVGVGTTFYFTLPFDKVKSVDYEQSELMKAFEKMEVKSLNILAVEDDPINMVLLEDTLKLYISNLKVSKAGNGIEAIEQLKKKDFDLIIMDIRMPKMDGYSATEKIRKELPEPKNKVPILGLSAHALKNEIEKGRRLGMNDFLSKPIRADELMMKIKKLTSVAQLINNDSTETAESLVTGNYKYIDLAFFIKLFKNNKEKIDKTLTQYVKQVPEQIVTIKQRLKDEEWEGLKSLAHSLKSTFKYIGRYDLSEMAREIEMCVGEQVNESDLKLKIKTIEKDWNLIKNEIIEKVLKKS